MSNAILGHGSTPTATNLEAARMFWADHHPLQWRKGEAVVTYGLTTAALSYRGHKIAVRLEDDRLSLATRGYNTMTTRRYLGAVLEAVGWGIVALNGQSVAIRGGRMWPDKKALNERIARGDAVIVGHGMTEIPLTDRERVAGWERRNRPEGFTFHTCNRHHGFVVFVKADSGTETHSPIFTNVPAPAWVCNAI